MNLQRQNIPGMGSVASIVARGGFFKKLNEHVIPHTNKYGEDMGVHEFTLFVYLNGKIKQAKYFRMGESEVLAWQ